MTRNARTLLFAICSMGCSTFSDRDEPPPLVEARVPDAPVFVFYVDGLRPDILASMASAGEMPNVQRLFIEEGAHVRHAVASMPSVTYANAVSLVTGQLPGTHGVFANTWFDRHGLLTRNYDGKRASVNDDLRHATLYELGQGRVSAIVGAAVRRGAHMQYVVDVGSGGLLPGIAWTLGMQEELDEAMAEAVVGLIDEARRIGELPTTTLFYFPAVDHAAHAEGCDSEAYRTALKSFDTSLGLLLDSLADVDILDVVTLVLTSDHGHVPTPHERSFDLAAWVRTCTGTSVLHASADDGGDEYATRRLRYDGSQVVMTISGARQASLHLRSGDTWRERPGLEEILAFPGEGQADDLAARLVRAPALDFVCVRAGADAVLLQGADGRARVDRTREGGEVRYGYRVVAGEDPLGYAADESAGRLLRAGSGTDREWLEATAHHRYPDLVPQLVEAFDTHRSGDVVLFAAGDWDFSENYAGGHGSVAREDVLIPLYFRGPGISPGTVVPAARLVDLVPTVLDLIGIDATDRPAMDGVSFAAALRGGEVSAK